MTPSVIAQSARTHSDVFFAGASDGEATVRSVLQNAWVIDEYSETGCNMKGKTTYCVH